MAKKNKGYVPIYRSIQDNWIWRRPEPFDYRSAWVDLLLSVNHEKKTIYIDGRVQDIQPGQMWTSIAKLADKWHWSRPKVYRYIKLLKSDGMVYTDGTPSVTLLTVVNWGSFTIQGNTNATAHATAHDIPHDTSGAIPSAIQTIMINNDKECKEREEIIPAPPVGGGEWQ